MRLPPDPRPVSNRGRPGIRHSAESGRHRSRSVRTSYHPQVRQVVQTPRRPGSHSTPSPSPASPLGAASTPDRHYDSCRLPLSPFSTPWSPDPSSPRHRQTRRPRPGRRLGCLRHRLPQRPPVHRRRRPQRCYRSYRAQHLQGPGRPRRPPPGRRHDRRPDHLQQPRQVGGPGSQTPCPSACWSKPSARNNPSSPPPFQPRPNQPPGHPERHDHTVCLGRYRPRGGRRLQAARTWNRRPVRPPVPWHLAWGPFSATRGGTGQTPQPWLLGRNSDVRPSATAIGWIRVLPRGFVARPLRAGGR